jgi:predicted O-methyltransferase YrrM
VEDDPAWYGAIAKRATKAKVVLLEGSAYVEKILEHPAGYFEVVSVDGSRRLECFRLALERVHRGGLLIVDNTDSDHATKGELFVIDQMLDELGPDWEVHRFPGWGPGNLYAWETTVCVRR